MIYEWYQNIEFKYAWLLPALLMLPVIVWLRYRMSRAFKSTLLVTSAEAFTVRTAKSSWIHFIMRNETFEEALIIDQL